MVYATTAFPEKVDEGEGGELYCTILLYNVTNHVLHFLTGPFKDESPCSCTLDPYLRKILLGEEEMFLFTPHSWRQYFCREGGRSLVLSLLKDIFI